MTFRMADSVDPSQLPDGMDAYLGYVDGRWPSYMEIARRFGTKPVFGLTVFGEPSIGRGVDVEPGDASIAQAVAATVGEMARGVDRPIRYCSESQAADMVAAHTAAGFPRSKYRLLTAHYTIKHICGPSTCGCPVQADGTQWIDHARVDPSDPTGHRIIDNWDESLLDDNFLSAKSHPGSTGPTFPDDIPPAQHCVGLIIDPKGRGYWEVAGDGGVFTHSAHDAVLPFFGSRGDEQLAANVVGGSATPTGKGYWLVGADGGVFTLGDAAMKGSVANIHLDAPVVAILPTRSGTGYTLVAADGGLFNFGDAPVFPSLADQHLAAPIVGAARSSNGMWLAGADGGVFNLGAAPFHGSLGNTHLAAPIVGMAARHGDDAGYWLTGADGGVFTFGNATFHGSIANVHLVKPVCGINATTTGNGYWLVAEDFGVFTFGDATFAGAGQ